MNGTLDKTRYLRGYYFCFILAVIYMFSQTIWSGYAKDDFGITEFLINYQGGFVRRGLLGEIILQLYHILGISPYLLILLLSTTAYLGLALFFIKSFIREGIPLFILPFVFFLGNPIINDFWVRKDVILVLLLICCLHMFKKRNLSFHIWINVLMTIGLLMHESIGFFCFPILLLLSEHQEGYKQKGLKSMLLSGLKLSPAISIFFLVVFFKGSKEIAEKIWQSWSEVPFPIPVMNEGVIPGAIDGISWSLKHGLSYTYAIFKNFNGGMYAPIIWVIVIIAIYFVLTHVNRLHFKMFKCESHRSIDKRAISNILIWQLISLSPLFVLGCDYGRWIFFWVTTSFSIYILIPISILDNLFPRWLDHIGNRVNILLGEILSDSRSFIVLICITLGFTTFSWHLFFAMGTNSIVIVTRFFSSPLEEFFLSLMEAISL